MKKRFIIFLFVVVVCTNVPAQIRHNIDSLKNKLQQSNADSSRVIILSSLSYVYRNTDLDTSIMYGEQALQLAQKIKFPRGESRALHTLASTERIQGDIPLAMETALKGLQLATAGHYPYEMAKCLNLLGITYQELNDDVKAMDYLQQAYKIYSATVDKKESIEMGILLESNIGGLYKQRNQLDSAAYYLQKAYKKAEAVQSEGVGSLTSHLGDLEFRLGHRQAALDYSLEAIQLSIRDGNHRTSSYCFNTRSGFFIEMKQPDSAIYYSKKGLAEAEVIAFKEGIRINSGRLALLYEPIDIKQALYYHKMEKSVNDELYGAKKIQALQKIISDEQQRQREIEAEKIAYQNRLRQYLFLAGLSILLLVAFILYRNNKQKQKANNLLHQQKEEIQQTLSQLKSTQSQLIQSEKMASLGELTAGIAHEIQNPLNFVNNFSEVNSELIEELKSEKSKIKSERDEQLEDDLLNDIAENEKKINHHGKRADAIVKGMLQHSQTSSGQKEPTDINKLADEYLRLSYHGLLAKDKSFNATMKTDYDETIDNINIIPQDIGRVLLNLYNNAFYATNEKSKQRIEYYEPIVSVSTKKVDDKVLISVKDNGNGIPQKIVEKIFQPFFTTKPTGQGTGLGLSLSYDIIKAHGGEIKVETKEGEGTIFNIILPLNQHT